MDTHENVDEHLGIGVDAGRNWEILFESCLTVRHQVHEFGAGNAIAGLVVGYEFRLMERETMVPNQGSESDACTLCFITRFVCLFDDLKSAKQCYQERLDEVRKQYEVVLASEAAFDLGQENLIFKLLLEEITGHGVSLSKEEEEKYSAFIFTTIINLPKAISDDEFLELIDLLELDYADKFPITIPSRTRAIAMSPSGEEDQECNWA